MAGETLEELRERLLGQDSVQQMIQLRAFEIYQMRGGRPGGEAQDWFHAEGEVLAFLIADESRLADLKEQAIDAPTTPATHGKPTAIKKSKSRDASGSKQPSPETTAPKRVTSKESTGSESKSKRARKKSKPKSIKS